MYTDIFKKDHFSISPHDFGKNNMYGWEYGDNEFYGERDASLFVARDTLSSNSFNEV